MVTCVTVYALYWMLHLPRSRNKNTTKNLLVLRTASPKSSREKRKKRKMKIESEIILVVGSLLSIYGSAWFDWTQMRIGCVGPCACVFVYKCLVNHRILFLCYLLRVNCVVSMVLSASSSLSTTLPSSLSFLFAVGWFVEISRDLCILCI